jgi:hypothetical protein
MSAAISASCCAGKGGLGGARYGQIKSDAATLPVYAVTFPRSVIGIDEQRMQGIHDIVFSATVPRTFRGSVPGVSAASIVSSTPRPTRQPD